MLTPWDDFPIHASADPVATPSSGDPHHYDRYFFNGQARDGAFYFGVAMGHYPVLGVIDGAFAVVLDGVQHSVFASGRMPLDRATDVGPIRIEVVDPMRTLRLSIAPNESGLTADLTWRARTVVIEEPRQRNVTPDGILVNELTRLTQWGRWEGTITVDGQTIVVEPARVFGTRDRSWGIRSLSTRIPSNRATFGGGLFWLWAPLHFDDLCTHLALHEYSNGTRWVESSLFVPVLESEDAPTWGMGVDNSTKMTDFRYDLDFYPNSRIIRSAVFDVVDPDSTKHRIELETLYSFRMRGIGYFHPEWGHGSIHGALAAGHESIKLDDFQETDPSTMHLQNVVAARMDGRTGIGVLEQALVGPHQPTGLSGYLDPPVRS